MDLNLGDEAVFNCPRCNTDTFRLLVNCQNAGMIVCTGCGAEHDPEEIVPRPHDDECPF